MDYYVPEETEVLLRNRAKECKNLGLLLDKYIPISVFEKPDKNDKNKGKTPWLTHILEPTTAQGDRGNKQNRHIDFELANQVYQRWLAMIKSMDAQDFQATLDWRMVIGLGGESVLETDITLHHLYGIPYIPASALKGLTRAYVTGEYKEYYVPEDKPEEQRLPSKNTEDDHFDIKRIFGSQKQAGTVIFFDAMPLNGITNFVLDIMNPHYPDYYNSLKSSNPTSPTNDQKPNPITFLTVADTIFTFALSPRDPKNDKHKDDLKLVKDWLQKALLNYGVGGKTSAGYGYFKKEMLSVEFTHLEKSQEPVTQNQAQSPPAERIQPKIPQFRAGQEITGSVVAPTDALRRIAPPDTRALLRFQSFMTTDVLIVVNAEETQNWKPGETRICVFEREEIRGGCTVLVCQPRPPKSKVKKK